MHHRSLRSAIGSAAALAMAVALATGGSLAAAPAARAADFPSYDSRYHTYAEMVAEIMAAQTAHPDIVRISSIGKSYQGRTIWLAKVSDNVAVDEDEPEVLFDGLHHAREHLSLEQTLAILRWLTTGYGTDPQITDPRRHARDLDRVRGQPRWRRVRPDRLALSRLAQEPPAERRLDRDRHRRQPQLRLPLGLLRRVVGVQVVETYHGSSAFSTPEARAIRDFIDSRRVNGRQQIKTAITFHTAGEQILWPYGYTAADVPWDMTADDHAALVALGRKMATTNGYTAMQSSSLYVTDGDEIDWAYGLEHVFMYTFEMYPSHSKVSSTARFYPADELIAPQTERNKAAVLMLIDAAGCPYSLIGKAKTNCGPLYDDLETYGGWIRNPLGTDTAKGGVWQRADPAPTSRQAGTVPSGSRALVTGYQAGSTANSNDVDGGVTSMRSSPIALPASVGPLTFRYYFAHSSNSSVMDWFRAYVEDANGVRTRVFQELGAMNTDLPSWATATIPMTPWAGQTVRIVFEAADLGRASTVEAGIDDIRITRP